MKTPAAPLRFALGPLLLATALGTAGFAAGRWLRVGPDQAFAASEPAPEPRATKTASHIAIQPTHSGPGGHDATPPGPDPAAAKARLSQWVAAGCPGGDPEEIWKLLKAWSAVEPWEALAFIHGAPRFRNRTRAYAIPLAVTARTAEAATLAWLGREIADEPQRTEILSGIIRALNQENPALALDLAIRHLPNNAYLASEAITRLARTDAASACASFSRLGSHVRSYCADDIARAWLSTDQSGGIAWCMAQAKEPWADRVMQALVQHLVRKDPEQLPGILSRAGVSAVVQMRAVSELGSSRPDLALDLISALPPELSRQALNYTFDDLFSEDPNGAVELGRSLLEPGPFATRVRIEWRRWLESDRPAATAWAATVTDLDLRHELELEAQTIAVARDPAAFLATTPPGAHSPETVRFLRLALAGIADADPAEAIRWASIHGEALTPDTSARISAALLHQAPDQVTAWIESLPRGAARDAACMQQVFASIEGKDATCDTSLLECIDDPDKKTQTRFEVFRLLHRRDSAAASQWLARQPLQPDVRASWQSIVNVDEFVGCCGPRF